MQRPWWKIWVLGCGEGGAVRQGLQPGAVGVGTASCVITELVEGVGGADMAGRKGWVTGRIMVHAGMMDDDV